jgi:glycosyltransferase involved in cell wall biosynthesis
MSQKLTIIIPAYNEELGIASTLEALLPLAKQNNWSIIVVNDGSNDNSQQILENISGIKLIKHPHNKGYGAALKTGIKAASSDYIAMYDADGQHNPSDLESMWSNIGNNDMLVGERGKNSHKDWIRVPGKWVLGKTANFLTGIKIPDLNSGLRIIKRDILINRLHLFSNSFSFSTTSTVALINLGYLVEYFPIKVNKRIGTSTVKQLKHGSNTILLILRLVMLFNPLKVFLPTSFILIFFGVIYEIIWGIVLNTGVSLLPTAVFLLISGVLIFLFGLIADQISEIRKQQIVNSDYE